MNRREFCGTMAALGAATKAEAYSHTSILSAETEGLASFASPSFPAADPAPLTDMKEGSLVLREGWQMREEAICNARGEIFSQASFAEAESWYPTTVPTTTLGTLIRHGVYPDPYIGLNNLLIPDASFAHSERYGIAKYSHLPDKANPWQQPYWFRSTFTLPPHLTGTAIWLHLDGIRSRPNYLSY